MTTRKAGGRQRAPRTAQDARATCPRCHGPVNDVGDDRACARLSLDDVYAQREKLPAPDDGIRAPVTISCAG